MRVFSQHSETVQVLIICLRGSRDVILFFSIHLHDCRALHKRNIIQEIPSYICNLSCDLILFLLTFHSLHTPHPPGTEQRKYLNFRMPSVRCLHSPATSLRLIVSSVVGSGLLLDKKLILTRLTGQWPL